MLFRSKVVVVTVLTLGSSSKVLVFTWTTLYILRWSSSPLASNYQATFSSSSPVLSKYLAAPSFFPAAIYLNSESPRAGRASLNQSFQEFWMSDSSCPS